MTVTIQKFRESRRRVNHGTCPQLADWDVQSEEAFVYGTPSNFWGYIEIVPVWTCPKDVDKPNEIEMYQLTLENFDWLRGDYNDLEVKLYEFMKDCGTFETPEEAAYARAERICEKAMQVFWSTVASSYTEIGSGDLSPEDTMHFENVCMHTIMAWRDGNDNS